MAKLYTVTEEEANSLLDRLTIQRMKDENIADPMRSMDDAWRQLSDHEKANIGAAIDSMNRGVHMIVVRWLQDIGFSGLGRR